MSVLYIYIINGSIKAPVGHGYKHVGVKEQILSSCLKGRFFAGNVFILNGKILCRALRSVPNRIILRNEHWRNFL